MWVVPILTAFCPTHINSNNDTYNVLVKATIQYMTDPYYRSEFVTAVTIE